MSRGNYNLKYTDGFDIEAEKFKEYYPIIKQTLKADEVELCTRGLLDKCTGTDALYLEDTLVFGISLRFRNRDYNSFTLSRHITDKFSEVHKWLSKPGTNMKPTYYIQISERPGNQLRLTRINIEAFSLLLQKLIKTDTLEEYYQEFLKAYEFPLDKLPPQFVGIHTEILSIE